MSTTTWFKRDHAITLKNDAHLLYQDVCKKEERKHKSKDVPTPGLKLGSAG